ncbi:hypothetical protein GCM10009846_26520 [Agrococcus versicolor]|uniref:T3SS peptide-binding chaperone domain-containing protein n=2 Tax=Agrococcus versicolor TaxID=501482 RepID=A0ABN3AWX1_9MICO
MLGRFTHERDGGVLLAKRHDVGVAANLVDGVRVLQQSGSTLFTWDTIFRAGGAHDIVRQIERISPLGIAESAPATTHRTLVYRLAAQLLALRLDDRHDWTIEPLDAAAVIQGRAPADSLGEVDGFPTVLADLAQQREAFASATEIRFDDPTVVPHLWVVRRDVHVAMVLDTDGFVHTRANGLVPAFTIYEERGRDLDRVVRAVLEAA